MKTERFIGWWKQDKRYRTLLKAVLMACLPIIGCLLYCAAQGKGIGQVYLPASGRNDELFYYKQVEAILEYGYPQGYFGFNESHALKLSFAAWSPVLLFPWILWGLLFGWNLMSPILCNIFLLTAAMFLFALLAKPDRRQIGIISLLYFLYVPFSWYMLSGMPEISCISLLVVFYGVAAAYLRRERPGLLALLFALAGVLTLMRPYLLLFLFLPGWFWISGPAPAGDAPRGRAVRWKAILGTIAVFAAVLGAYAWINHFLAAEYFRPLFYMDWLTAFFERGLIGGLKNFFGSLYYSGTEFMRYMKQGLIGGLPAGAIFCCYVAMLLLLLCQSARDALALGRLRARKETDRGLWGRLVLEAHLAFAFLGMLVALLLMYNFYDGCKHLLTFLAVGLFAVGMMRTAYFKKAALVGVVFAYFFLYRATDFRDYQAAFVQEDIEERMEEFSLAAGQELVLTREGSPNYDNVVIWVLSDRLPEGETATGWQYLYSVPAGFGISCCLPDYVLEHMESLESRYLCVVPGGPVEEACDRLGYERIVGNEYAVLYRRY